jgi:dihydrofolate reductase
MHLAVSPVLLGEGEHFFQGMNLHELGFTSIHTVAGEGATHVFLKKA